MITDKDIISKTSEGLTNNNKKIPAPRPTPIITETIPGAESPSLGTPDAPHVQELESPRSSSLHVDSLIIKRGSDKISKQR